MGGAPSRRSGGAPRDGPLGDARRPSERARGRGPGPVKVSCPACGGPLTFKVGSVIVAVCPYCRSVVARGDRQLENLGKVAELVETDSVLQVGLSGRYQGVPFTLTGRTQLGHQAGGVWDEWYAAFADGRWGWLAEARGRFHLTFERPAAAASVPAFKWLKLGQQVPLPGLPELLVAEKGQARAVRENRWKTGVSSGSRP